MDRNQQEIIEHNDKVEALREAKKQKDKADAKAIREAEKAAKNAAKNAEKAAAKVLNAAKGRRGRPPKQNAFPAQKPPSKAKKSPAKKNLLKKAAVSVKKSGLTAKDCLREFGESKFWRHILLYSAPYVFIVEKGHIS